MPPKTNAEAKKKARDDALQFLETLDINDDEAAGNDEALDSKADAPEAAAAAAPADSTSAGGDGKKDPKSMLKFIDDLTESAKRSVSPGNDEADNSAATADSSAVAAARPSSNSWSWGGIWGQATAL
ncbi:hypothetical protein GGI12_002623, partial [Dipsacomyces acuminosporus]